MPTTQHRDMAGADLHEPKGVSSAPDGAIFTASGGVSTWSQVISAASVSLVGSPKPLATIQFTPRTNLATPSTIDGMWGPEFTAGGSEVVNFNFTLPDDFAGSSPYILIHLHYRRDTSIGTEAIAWDAPIVSTASIAATNDGTRTTEGRQVFIYTIEETPAQTITCQITRGSDSFTGGVVLGLIQVQYPIMHLGAPA